jgi:hypothetical protein
VTAATQTEEESEPDRDDGHPDGGEEDPEVR